MRTWFLILSSLLNHGAFACTAFIHTHNGRTIIGCNEDAWSINAQVRFEQGRTGRYGGIYFGHSNGSPFRAMTDQMGMNEVGLVFDGLVLPPQAPRRAHGGRQVAFDELMPLMLRSCADVHEAADLLRTIDLGWLSSAMVFLADHNGEYLLVESDTMIFGNDASIAVGNWRMSTCTDPDAIPIPRLQAGRALLSHAADSSLTHGAAVLERMKACRSRLGEGTLFSALFEPGMGKAHLFFYHDFHERVTFDLQAELRKGDRTLPMPALFGDRPEYESLLDYKTPFHQRWLWWTIAGVGLLSLLGIAWAFGLFMIWVVACIRSRSFIKEQPWLLVGLSSVLAAFLCATLLIQEGVYYFGLGSVLDRIHPQLVYTPLVLLVSVALVVFHTFRHARYRGSLRVLAVLHGLLIIGLAYWGLLLP